jgi:hypothetical protein
MIVALVTTPVMALSTNEVLWGVSRFFAGLGVMPRHVGRDRAPTRSDVVVG